MCRSLQFLLLTLILGLSGTAFAEIAYEYRTPKGVTIFTDTKLTHPFKLIRKVNLKPKKDRRRNSYNNYVKKKQLEYDAIFRKSRPSIHYHLS